MTSTAEAPAPVIGPPSGGWTRRVLATVPLRYLGLLGVCFILMKPSMVDQDPRLAPVVKALTAMVLAGLLLVHTRRRTPLSAVFVLFLLYRWVMLLPTVLNSGDLLNWGYVTVAQISVLLLIDLHVRAPADDRLRLLRVIADLLVGYLLINYVMILAGWGTEASWGNDLLAQPSYLLGIRTRVTDTIFPALMVCVLHDTAARGRWGIRSVLALVLGVVQITTLEVATAVVGALVALAVYLVVARGRDLAGLATMRGATVAGVAITVLVVFLRVQVHLRGLIEDGLGKSVSLTGRTDLWDAALPILERSPLIGYGVNEEFGAFVPGDGGILWQAHNQYLQIAHDAGLLGLALFLAMMWRASSAVDASEMPASARGALVAVYTALSVMSVSEIYIYNMALLHLVVFLAARAPELLEGLPRGRAGR